MSEASIAPDLVALHRRAVQEFELVDFVHRYQEPTVEARALGVFAEAVEPPPGADRQTSLLAMTGRRV